MRTISAGLSSVLTDGYFTTYAKVLVATSTSTTPVFQDMTSFQNRNWVLQASWTEGIDQPVAQATVEFIREVDLLSLAPLMGNSKLNNGAPAVTIGRRLQIQTATVPVDSTPVTADWVTMFDGYIDEIDPAKESMTVTCRDQGAILADQWIRTEGVQYGSSGGIAVQTIMQSIIDDAINTPKGWLVAGSYAAWAILLYTPVSPSWNIKSFYQAKMPVIEALRNLVVQIAWDVRYKWDSGTSAFRPTLYNPNRSASVVRTFTADDYDDISAAKTSRVGVRNYVVVPYSDFASGTRQKAIASDVTSQNLYDFRYCEISEASTSQINTVTEAQKMADGALADLKDPIVEQTVEMPYFFAVELGDRYTWSANGRHYDSAQSTSVFSYTHTIDKDGSKTSMQTRGVPCARYAQWFALEGRSGVAPTANLADPSGGSNVSGLGSPSSIVVLYDPPSPASWLTTEIYGKVDNGVAIAQTTSSGKYQKPSGSGVTLMASGRKTRFTIDGLTPGTTYRLAIVVIDLSLNISVISSEIIKTAEQIGPYHETKDGQKDQLLRNPDFNIFTLGTGLPPDGWTPLNFTWAASNADTTHQTSGKKCWYMPDAGVPGGIGWQMQSDSIPCAGGEIINASCYVTALAAASRTITVELVYYDAAGTQVGTASSATVITDTNAHNCYLSNNAAPSTARYVALLLAGTLGFYMDRAYIQRGYPYGKGVFLPGPSFNNAWTNKDLTFASVALSNVSIVTSGAGNAFKIAVAGSYVIHADYVAHTSYVGIANLTIELMISHDNGGSWSTIASGTAQAFGATNYPSSSGYANPRVNLANVELLENDLLKINATSDRSATVDAAGNADTFYIGMVARSET